MEDPVRFGVGGGDALRISVVRYDKPLPAMPEESEPTPVEGGMSVANWKHGNGRVEEAGASWGGISEEGNCE